jgi:hypothetical protein
VNKSDNALPPELLGVLAGMPPYVREECEEAHRAWRVSEAIQRARWSAEVCGQYQIVSEGMMERAGRRLLEALFHREKCRLDSTDDGADNQR